VDYISKPFQPEEVLARVTAHLRIREMSRELEKAKECLERRVEERTAELARANRKLQSEIVQRIRAEAELRDSEERLRLTLEATNIGTFDWDVKNDLWYATPTWFTMLGYEYRPGLMDRDEWLERVHPDDRAFVREQITKTLTRDFKKYEYEARMRHADGAYRWIAVAGFGIERDGDGKVSRVLGIRTDITERKRAEEALYSRERMFRTLAENSPDIIIRYDCDCRRVYANPAFENLVRLPLREVLGKIPWESWRLPISSVPYMENLKRVLESGVANDYEHCWHTAEGDLIHHHVRLVPECDQDGKVVSVLAVIRDISELKKKDESLRIKELAISSSTSGIHFADLNGVLIYVNRAFLAMYGVECEEEMLGRHVTDFVTSDRIAEIITALDRQGSWRGEVVGAGKDGETYVYDATTHLIRDEEGKPLCFMGIVNDITERKRAEKQLSLLNFALNNVHEAAFLIDEQGRFHYVNYESCRALGYSRDELLGLTVADVDPDRPLVNWPDHWRDLKARGSSLFEGRHRNKQGHIFPVEISANYFEYEGLAYNLALARDITERKRMEVGLKESEARYRSLFEESIDGVFISSVEGKFIDINLTGVRMFGYDTKEEVKRLDLARNVYANPEDRNRILKEVDTSGSGEYEVYFRKKSGETMLVRYSIAVIRDAEGRIAGYQGVVRDVTEEKRLEQELFKAKKMEIIGQLAGGVAHEVRNPLNAILSISEALFREQEIAENPEYIPYIHHIRTQVGRLSKLMTDLLDLGKPIRPGSIHPVSLYDVVAETLSLWNMTEAARKYHLSFNGDDNHRSLMVKADSTRLQQALLNLMENAAQHSPAGSEICLRIGKPGGQEVFIQVRDSGKGIAPEKIGRIFEPFFTTRTGGTGLGLSLVKHFVESMGGEVRIRNNEPPPGCTAELVLIIAGEEGERVRETENTFN
jgi:PAS domain S-box-containing protein